MNVPIVLFAYNRPEKVAKILQVLKALGVYKVYFFIDGAQQVADCIANAKVFNLINSYEGNCEIHKNKTNLGLNTSVITGLKYVFSKEKYAIILEDDCLPKESFFEFCYQMLLKYETENQVMHINGFTIFNDDYLLNSYEHDYLFTRFSLPSWGWATWARAWKNFNPKMNTWELHKNLIFSNFQQKNYAIWSKLINVKYRETRIWDVQWMLDIIYSRGLVISPKTNLVTNIGFDSEATTTKTNNVSILRAQELTFPLKNLHTINVFEFEKEFENQLCDFIAIFVK